MPFEVLRTLVLTAIAIVMIALALLTSPKAHAADDAGAFWREQYAQGRLLRPVEGLVRQGAGLLHRGAAAVVDEAVMDVRAGYMGGAGVVRAASRYIGSNPTGWAHNWCAEFANRILRQQGYAGSGSAMAISFAHYGPHVPPRPGAIGVLRGHVGFVARVLPGGRVLLVSGNGGHRRGVRGRVTASAVYPRSAFVAFVMPRRAIRFART